MTQPTKTRFAGVAELRSKLPEIEVEPVVEAPRRSAGRPRGKASNPAYTQVTVYLSKDRHKAAQKLLIDDETMDFSDLVDSLLGRWLDGK